MKSLDRLIKHVNGDSQKQIELVKQINKSQNVTPQIHPKISSGIWSETL